MKLINTMKEYQFLFEELISRDFKEKYKRTILGVFWSVLSPLLNLLILTAVFTKLLGRDTPHYSIYIFCGTLVMSYFKESTKSGMKSLMGNKSVITKINIPKYLFLLSSNVSCLINFGITLCVFFLLTALDGITFSFRFLLLLFPIACLLVFNIGVGLILSALFVFFKDTSYLYDLLLTVIHYLSAIFYKIDKFSPTVQKLYLLNPIYVYIKFFRLVVIDGVVPSIEYFGLGLLYAVIALVIGAIIYKKNNHKFLYYM